MISQNIRKQHEDIRQIIKELREDVYDLEGAAGSSLWIALKIGTLNGIIQMHLKYEDEYLYPLFLNNTADNELRELAHRFVSEMGNLAEQFKVYQEKYLRNPETIKKDTKQFVNETEEILKAISKRIDIEENELFKIAEKQGDGYAASKVFNKKD